MDLSAIQIIIVLVIALLVFGPKRLPHMARQVGKGVRELRRHMSEATDDFKRAVDEIPPPDPAPVTSAAAESVSEQRVDEATDDELLSGIVVSGDTPPAPRSGAGA